MGEYSSFLLIASVLLVIGSGALAGLVALDLVVKPRRQILERLTLIARRLDGPVAFETEDVLMTEKRALLPQRFVTLVAWAGGWEALRLPVLVASITIVAVWAAAEHVFMAGIFLSTVCALGIATTIFLRMLKGTVQRRQLAFLEELPAAIDLIVRAAQAGLPITEAIAVAGKELGEPVGTEFTTIAHLVQLGVDLKTTLYEAAERVNLLDFDCFVVALVVQRETGGQLSETMRNLATIVRRRKETRGKARGMTAEGRLTAKVVAALPFFTGAVMAAINPGYMELLVTDPLGRRMLLVSIAAVVIGFEMITQMTKMEM